MLNLLEHLPVELLGTHVLGYISLKDIVMLERACGSKKSHQVLLDLILYCPSIKLPLNKQRNKLILDWFVITQCRIDTLTLYLPGNIDIEGLNVDYFNLEISANLSGEYKHVFKDYSIRIKFQAITIFGNQNKEVIEQLSACTSATFRSIKELSIMCSYNCMNWLTVDVLSRWKLNEFFLASSSVTTSDIVTLIAQTCTELTSITLDSHAVDDAAVIAIAQHCSKLENFVLLDDPTITYNSLLALSERGLPLKQLEIYTIPYIPTADIARRCSHALSCIRYLTTENLSGYGEHANLLLPYMTGLTSVYFNHLNNLFIPLLTKHFSKLTEIEVCGSDCHVTDMLTLYCANPLLQKLLYYHRVGISDTTLIELIHVCPHLHTLRLPYETDITDIGILALSEHCSQLQCLEVTNCKQLTEAAVLQLLQRCRKLTRLEVSNSSLSEETWTQLDKNIQKRVRRC